MSQASLDHQAAIRSSAAKAARRKRNFTSLCVEAGVTSDLTLQSFKLLVEDDKRYKKVRSLNK